MKVVYFGSDVFLSCFEYFLQEHEVLELYTYHNDEDYFSEYTIVKMARERGIPVHYEAITSQEVVKLLQKKDADCFFQPNMTVWYRFPKICLLFAASISTIPFCLRDAAIIPLRQLWNGDLAAPG